MLYSHWACAACIQTCMAYSVGDVVTIMLQPSLPRIFHGTQFSLGQPGSLGTTVRVWPWTHYLVKVTQITSTSASHYTTALNGKLLQIKLSTTNSQQQLGLAVSSCHNMQQLGLAATIHHNNTQEFENSCVETRIPWSFLAEPFWCWFLARRSVCGSTTPSGWPAGRSG